MSLVDDPLQGGIADFGRRLRAGETTAAAATEAYLARIAALDPALRAYEHVGAESARRAAAAMDALLRSGTDL
jgi:Asp-tRNA(Asn)/Glu-tRNA(Gln) amidotransferase A subunit family amidase